METSETATRSLVCPECGHVNPSYRLQCAECGAMLTLPKRETQHRSYSNPSASTAKRPGCLAAYTVLMGIMSAALALGGLVGGVSMMSDGDAGSGLLVMAGGLIGGGLYFLLTRGLWRMRNWARILMLVLSALSIVSSVVTMCESLSGAASGTGFFTGLLGIIVPGIIFYWFYDNGHLFS